MVRWPSSWAMAWKELFLVLFCIHSDGEKNIRWLELLPVEHDKSQSIRERYAKNGLYPCWAHTKPWNFKSQTITELNVVFSSNKNGHTSGATRPPDFDFIPQWKTIFYCIYPKLTTQRPEETCLIFVWIKLQSQRWTEYVVRTNWQARGIHIMKRDCRQIARRKNSKMFRIVTIIR